VIFANNKLKNFFLFLPFSSFFFSMFAKIGLG